MFVVSLQVYKEEVVATIPCYFVVYGSSAHAVSDAASVTETTRFALIVGNETTGMSPFLTGLSEIVLCIPMHGSASSLNVATAASILIYELSRSRTNE